MNRNILTIAIPTYNRPKNLLKTVEALIPQLNEYSTLVIIDNFSDEPVDSIIDNNVECKHEKIKVVRNFTNIGGSANALRCFEFCQSPYLWILGDDDIPNVDAVSIILDYIDDYPESIFFNFSSDLHKRSDEFQTKGLIDFVNKFDSYSNLLFLSNNIYRIDSIVGSLRYGYHYAYSSASQLAILIQSIKKNDTSVCFPNKRIVNRGIPEKGNHWSVVIQSLGYNILVELPIVVQNGLTVALGKRLAESKLSVNLVVRELLFLSEKKEYNMGTSRYLFNQILYRRYYFESFYYKLYRVAIRLVFRFPSIVKIIYISYWKLINKKEYKHIKDSYFNQK